ncbi:WhiB family transcriptional regulator [Streptomyces sp. NBC_00306]|uniref:WhiB family transcriptional regulator n=1 Tax=Streptomyces sp. NBC_00306 TaxID=2975708 RepID=UPI002E28B810|nr:WhiB family transcriptional regulator [Streptomyces sp. NBC_00306]
MRSRTLPRPKTADDNAWRAQAACADPAFDKHRDLWFPVHQDKEDTAEAKRVCRACPVVEACLISAMRMEGGQALDARHGIYGGLTPRERRRLYERVTA